MLNPELLAAYIDYLADPQGETQALPGCTIPKNILALDLDEEACLTILSGLDPLYGHCSSPLDPLATDSDSDSETPTSDWSEFSAGLFDLVAADLGPSCETTQSLYTQIPELPASSEGGGESPASL